MSEVKSEIPLSDPLWLASALRVSGMMRTGKMKSGDGKKAKGHTEREGKRKLTGRNSKGSESSISLDWLIILL